MYIEVIQQEAGMRVTVLLAAVSPANPLFIPNDATKEEIVKMCVEYGERVADAPERTFAEVLEALKKADV